MTVQVVVSSTEPKCPRGDRLQEEPSAKNAQGLFPPEACIFVGNLSTKVPTETLAEDLKSVFTGFGACHVKIKQDKKKGLPGAFVQFERVEDASAALANEESMVLHDRPLRIERAKGRRTACLGLRSLQPITAQDVVTALAGRGSLECYTIEPQQTGMQTWTDVAKVTFAFVDDCRDAIKYFQKDEKYYLHLLDMDGSPLLQGPVQGPTQGPPHFKPYNGHFARGGNFHPRNTNNRHYRNGNGRFNNRGGYRGGLSKPHQPPMNHENMPPHGGYLPSPPVSMNGMPIYSDSQPPFFPFPPPGAPPPPGPNCYGPPPLVFNGFPGYMGPHPPPEAFGPPPVSNALFVVGGMPAWSHPPHNFYPGQYFYENGYISPEHGTNGPNGYFGPVGAMTNSEPWAGQPTFTPSPPHINNHGLGHREAPTPAPVKPLYTKVNDVPTGKVQGTQSLEADIVGGVPYPTTPEKAPRLIRVYHNDDADEDLKNGSDNASTVNGIVVSVEAVADSESATEADSRSRSRSRSLSRDPRRSRSQSPSRSRSNSYSGSQSRSASASGIRMSSETDSAPPSDSEKSKKTAEKSQRKKTVRWSNDTAMDKPRSPSNSTTSTTSIRTCAFPPPKAMDTVVLKTGISLEEYVRSVADGQDLSEEFLQDVIQSLNEEFKGRPKEKQTDKAPQQEKQDLLTAKEKIKEGPKEEQTNKGPQQEKQDLLAAFKEEIKEGLMEELKEEHINEASQQEQLDLVAGTNACQLVTGTDSCASRTGSAVRKRLVKLARAHPG